MLWRRAVHDGVLTRLFYYVTPDQEHWPRFSPHLGKYLFVEDVAAGDVGDFWTWQCLLDLPEESALLLAPILLLVITEKKDWSQQQLSLIHI